MLISQLQEELKQALETSAPIVATHEASFEDGELPLEDEKLTELTTSLDLLHNAKAYLEKLEPVADEEMSPAMETMFATAMALALPGVALEPSVEAESRLERVKERIKAVIKMIGRMIKRINAVVRDLFEKYVLGAKSGLKKAQDLANKLVKADMEIVDTSFELPGEIGTRYPSDDAMDWRVETAKAVSIMRHFASQTPYKGALEAAGRAMVQSRAADPDYKFTIIVDDVEKVLGELGMDKAWFTLFSDTRSSLNIGACYIDVMSKNGNFRTSVGSRTKADPVKYATLDQSSIIDALVDIQNIYQSVMEANPKLFLDAANKMEDVLTKALKDNEELTPKQVSDMASSISTYNAIMRDVRNSSIKLVLKFNATYFKYVRANIGASKVTYAK